MLRDRFAFTLFLVNVFSSTARDGLMPLAATYLLVQENWTESRIGTVIFANLLATTLFQSYAGDVTDKTTNKRLLLSTAVLGVGVMCVLMVTLPSYGVVLTTRIVQGAASAIVAPGIAAITLGVMGPADFDAQIATNEIGNNLGYAAVAVGCGALAFFVQPSATFIFVMVVCVIAAGCIFAIPAEDIDDDMARGLDAVQQSDSPDGEPKAAAYSDLLANPQVVLFCVCVCLFHFANANMLPLLGQMLATGSGRGAIPLSVATILIGRGSMAVVAFVIHRIVDSHSRKALFLVGLVVLPLRGVLIACLVGHRWPLLLTQLLDGLGSGVYRVMHQIIAQDLAKGTGRFSLLLGLVTTCEMLGAACSNLLGEVLAEDLGYKNSFLTLSAIATVPMVLFLCFFVDRRGAASERSPLRAKGNRRSGRVYGKRAPRAGLGGEEEGDAEIDLSRWVADE